MCCHLPVEGPSFRWASQAIGAARHYQDRHIFRNSADRLQGRNLIQIGQKEWSDGS